MTRQLNAYRLEADSIENLAPWFSDMGAMLNIHHYNPENIYNMDESGFGIGTTQSSRVLVVRGEVIKGKGKASKAISGRQEWVTSIECVSASGQLLPPLVIFKATGTMNARWLPDEPEVRGWR